MPISESAALPGQGPTPPSGLPIGDMRGFGRVRGDASLASLAIDRAHGLLKPSHPERPLLSLHMDGEVDWAAAYVPGTNVLESTGRTDGAELRVVDFMAVAEGRPGQPEAVPAGRFVRIVTCTEGEAVFRLVCAAAVDGEPGMAARTCGGWFLACSRPLAFTGDVATAHVRLEAGESVSFVIAQAAVAGGAALVPDTLHGLGDTIHYWSWWSDRCRYAGEDVETRLRHALGLKLACSPEHGMLVEGAGGHFVAAAPATCSHAAATFLELGFRQECVQLLGAAPPHAAANATDLSIESDVAMHKCHDVTQVMHSLHT